jgi:hypothetical protein
MEENPGLSLTSWKVRLKDAGHLILQFARNPMEGMRQLPDWDWPFLLTCQAIAGATAGVGAGIVAGSFTRIFTGLLFVPISTALMTAVISGFFYYTFTFVFQRPASFHRIYTHMVFSQLPALVMFMVSPVLPPLVLLGPLAAGFLLLFGFVENLGQDRRKTFRLLAGLYGVFVVFWIFSSISQKRQIEAYRDRATPESLDILEKELKEK